MMVNRPLLPTGNSEMANGNIQAIVEKCTAPIPGDNPCGEEARYDPDYDEARTEVQKLTAMSSAQDAIDWSKVVECSTRILAEKSKDLTISGYLCIGLARTEAYTGLNGGLEIFITLLEQYWDGLYPPVKKLKRRLGVLGFLNERLGDIVVGRAPASNEVEAVREAYARVEKIREILSEKLGPEAPTMWSLLQTLKERVQEAAPATPSAAEPGSAPTPQAGAPAAPSPPTGMQEPPDSPGEAIEMVRRMIPILRDGDATDCIPYRLLRCLKWDHLETEPPCPNADGITRVPAPRPGTRTSLDHMLEAGNWNGLLDASERAFQDASGTFWLDLQRFACTALRSLGADYERVYRVVVSETSMLLERFPNLANLSFDDSTPFVDDATKLWIEEEVHASAQQAPRPESGALESKATEQMNTDFREAQKKAARKDLKAALDILQRGIDAEPSRRGRFVRKLEAAKLCMNSGRPAWAMPVLEGLDQEADRLSLEQWEPDLCIEVWGTLSRCYKKLLASKKVEMAATLRERAADVRAKLFRLDLGSAVGSELGKK